MRGSINGFLPFNPPLFSTLGTCARARLASFYLFLALSFALHPEPSSPTSQFRENCGRGLISTSRADAPVEPTGAGGSPRSCSFLFFIRLSVRYSFFFCFLYFCRWLDSFYRAFVYRACNYANCRVAPRDNSFTSVTLPRESYAFIELVHRECGMI